MQNSRPQWSSSNSLPLPLHVFSLFHHDQGIIRAKIYIPSPIITDYILWHKGVEGLGTIKWNGNGNQIFQSLNHVDINLKPQLSIMSGLYIVPSPSIPLLRELHLVVDVYFDSKKYFLKLLFFTFMLIMFLVLPNVIIWFFLFTKKKNHENPPQK